MTKNPYGNPHAPSIWAKDGLKRFEVLFRAPGCKDDARDYPLAATGEDARKIIVERYGCDILVHHVVEAS